MPRKLRALTIFFILCTLVLALPLAASAATTVVVKPSNTNGWGFLQETATGSGGFVAGPGSPPLGAGSAQLQVDATGGELVGAAILSGTLFSNITNLQYSTYRSSGDSGNNLAAALQINVDYDLTDANTAWQGRLIFEPYQGNGGGVPQSTWQTWSPVSSGLWWASGAPGDALCPQATPCSWAQVLTNWPNAGIHATLGGVGFKAGSSWAGGFTGNVDAFTIGVSGVDTTYDFEPDCTTTCYADAGNGDDANSGLTAATAKKTIQAAVNQVNAGGAVIAAAGVYTEDVTIGKALTLTGAGIDQSIIAGLKTGPNTATVRVSTNAGVQIAGFTITRDGNNTTDWATNVKLAGLAVQGTAGNVELKNSKFMGNRTAIDLNFTSGNYIHNNIIDFNRTGIVLRNQCTNNRIEENQITNNWTVGILWLAASTEDATNTRFYNNAIDGNWYAQIENRSLTGGVKNFSGNWLGTPTPTTANTNGSEPDYTSLIPVAYGGAATPPGGALTVRGVGLADMDYTPWLNSGTDTNVDHGTGIIGFQGDFSTLWVDTASAQYGPTGRIQEGVTLVSGSTVNVLAGTYAENVVITKTVDLRGPNYGISPNGGLRVPEAVLVPATNAIATGEVIAVAAPGVSGVSIDGFTIDGDNVLLTSGYTSTTAADINAAEGVTVYYDNVNNLTVAHNIFQNLSYFGVTLFGASYSAPATTGHLVEDNLFRDLGTYAPGSGIANWGGGVLLYNNQYARVANSVMTNVRIGVQTGNFSRANPGAATYQVIDGNAMSVRRRGIFHNLQYGPASPYTLSNNSITALANANETVWDGILLASLSVASSSTNNVIDGSAVGNPSEGYEVWNVKSTTPAAIAGGSVRGVRTGVFVNNFEGYSSSAGDGAHAVVSGLTVTATANGIGVRVLDSPSSTHAAVSLTVKDDSEIVQTGLTGAGIRVEGAQASATVQDNDASISGFAVGIDVITGTVSITNNHIFNNGIGIRFADTGAGTATGNTIATNGTGVLVENGGTATLTCNNIAGNTTYGVNNTTGVTIDAEGNWWGSASGPTHPSNPTGAGDVVSDNVDFTPWTLAAAPGGCGSLSSASVGGYFYLAATGEIVAGGSVTVSSPAVVASSGVSGAYQWLTDGTAGTYALGVTPPAGYALSTSCPAQVGPYTPSGVFPIYLGAAEVGNTGVLSDNTCAANPYYLSFNLGASPFIYNNNLPLQGTGAIAGLIWNDIVTDSVQTPPEPPLANVEVQVYGAGLDNTLRTTDDLVYTATTNASGVYTVANLAPDQYLIRLEGLSLPVGFEPRNSYEITVTLGAGQVLPNENFPLDYIGKAVIGNYVWDDLDGDGDLAGDPGEAEFLAGLDGVTLSLYLNPDNSGTFDPVNDLLLDVTTTGDDPTSGGAQTGWYRFLAAADGSLAFWVVVDASNFQPGGALEGYVQTFPAPGDNTRAVIGLPLAGTDADVDFAYTSTQGRIGDLVWYDTDGDGVRDPGEPGIPGVGLDLGLPGGGISTTTTSASGLYTFGNLLPGLYTVTVASGLPPGAVNTVGPDSKLSPYTLTLTSGQVVTTADFGFDVPTSYTVTKTLEGVVPPVKPGDILSFTIRITNTGASWLTAFSLRDLYDRRVLRFEDSTPASDFPPLDDGQIDWTNVLTTPLAPGNGVAVLITFTAIRDPGAQYNNETVNTAIVAGVQADPDGNGPLGSIETAPDASATAKVKILSPTAADLANLAVVEQGDGSVLLSWETTNEANLAGFHVLRQVAGGAPARLTGELLVAQHSGQPAGASYAFRDTGATPGTAYLYILQLQRLDGMVEEVVLGGTGTGAQLFLPAIAR